MSQSKLKLIINGDDFGMAQNINEGILKAHTHGILTSTSIVPQGLAFDHAVDILKKNPSLDVGIHLTLIEETPLLRPEEVPTLVNKSGKFFSNAKQFFKRYLLGRISKDDVQRELEAQFKKVLNTGIKITHIDGHQHMHVLKDVFNATIKLAFKYDIPVIRIPEEKIKLHNFFRKKVLPRILSLYVLNFISRQRRNENNLIHTDHFAGFLFGGKLNKNNLLTLLQHLPGSGVCEVMCHPGMKDNSSIYSHWGSNWSSELDALTDKDILNFINEKGIELVNFDTLIKTKRNRISL